MQLKQVILIGAGNVAWHLGRRLHEQGIRIAQVYSRQLDHAEALGRQLACPATDQTGQILPLDHCLYLLIVSDDAIIEMATQLAFLEGPQRVFAHTSGAVPGSVLVKHFSRSGVFYPLQTLSKDRSIDLANVPICLHADDPEIYQALYELAVRLSDHVFQIDDQARKVLHVAAVFVNNFSNYLFAVGKQILDDNGLSFDLLRPLIGETAAKITDRDPEAMQTGPAIRNDQQTIIAHLRFLQQYPEYQNLYRMITHAIREMHHQKELP